MSLLWASALAVADVRIGGAQYLTVTIPNTELRFLHLAVTGRDYDLYVAGIAYSAPATR